MNDITVLLDVEPFKITHATTTPKGDYFEVIQRRSDTTYRVYLTRQQLEQILKCEEVEQ